MTVQFKSIRRAIKIGHLIYNPSFGVVIGVMPFLRRVHGKKQSGIIKRGLVRDRRFIVNGRYAPYGLN
jgi:hypothetical protein